MRKADNLTTIMCRCHEIWKPSWNTLSQSRPVTGLPYLLSSCNRHMIAQIYINTLNFLLIQNEFFVLKHETLLITSQVPKYSAATRAEFLGVSVGGIYEVTTGVETSVVFR